MASSDVSQRPHIQPNRYRLIEVREPNKYKNHCSSCMTRLFL